MRKRLAAITQRGKCQGSVFLNSFLELPDDTVTDVYTPRFYAKVNIKKSLP